MPKPPPSPAPLQSRRRFARDIAKAYGEHEDAIAATSSACRAAVAHAALVSVETEAAALRAALPPSPKATTGNNPKPKRGRPPGPDYGLSPSDRRRLRRHRAAAQAQAAAAQAADRADLHARLLAVCKALVMDDCNLSAALVRAGISWKRLRAYLRRDPDAADLYRASVEARDSDRANARLSALETRWNRLRINNINKQIARAKAKGWNDAVRTLEALKTQ